MVVKYLDTYILCEIAKGNTAYKQYTDEPFIMSDLTLAEFYGVLARDTSLTLAEEWLEKLKPNSVAAPLSSLLQAVLMKNKLHKRNLSFFDVFGYVFALERNIPFVTGDKEFKNLPGVEFVPSS